MLKEHSGSEHVVWLADSGKGDGSLRGVSSFREEPFVISGILAGDLPLYPGQFEDRQILYFDTREIESLEYVTTSETIHIEKRGSDWFLTRPVRKSANKPAVWRLLFTAENLSFILRAPDGLKKDLAGGRSIELTLYGADGKMATSLTLYTDSEDGKVYAESSDREGLFLIDAAVIAELPAGSRELIFTR